MTISIMTISIMTISIMTFSIMGLFATLNIITHSIQCRYGECHDYLNVTLIVLMLNVVMQSVVMLSVVAPYVKGLVLISSKSAQ